MTSWSAGRTPATAAPSRAFERSLRQPSASGPEAPRGYLYAPLMSVAFRNSYFNLEDGRCPTFRTRPTPTSERLMRDLGLLFKDEPAGFKVLYDVNRTSGLIEYLRRQAEPGPAAPLRRPVWTRLSFLLQQTSRRFVSFTDVPIDLNPSTRNFFFANTGTHERSGGAVVLNRGSRVTGKQLLPTIPVQYSVPVGPEVERVDVRDLSGAVVLSEQRCVASKTEPPVVVCRDVLFLDFTHLPEDRYVIEEVGLDGAILRSEKVLYTETHPISLGLADLLFASPDGAHPDAFPVRDLFGARPEVVGTSYVLLFERRAVPWRYFVVPRRVPLEQPHIEGPASFQGPEEVTLPDGARAFRFTSEGALPLLQESPDRFRLLGRLGPHKSSRVLIDPLPTASPSQVMVQDTPGGPLPLTDMYVYL